MQQQINLQEIHDFLGELAREAGELIVAAHPSTLTAGSKKNCEYILDTWFETVIADLDGTFSR